MLICSSFWHSFSCTVHMTSLTMLGIERVLRDKKTSESPWPQNWDSRCKREAERIETSLSRSTHQMLKSAAKLVQVDKNILCGSWYPILILTLLCHSLSSLSHIHLSLPFGSVNPFCTPPVHFLWPPPPHLSNGGIVLMDCPKQQRGRHYCHSTFTPPLHSYPLHPSVSNRSGNMHSVFFFFLNFPLSCRPGNPLRFEEKLFHLDWPSSRGSLLLCHSK